MRAEAIPPALKARRVAAGEDLSAVDDKSSSCGATELVLPARRSTHFRERSSRDRCALGNRRKEDAFLSSFPHASPNGDDDGCCTGGFKPHHENITLSVCSHRLAFDIAVNSDLPGQVTSMSFRSARSLLFRGYSGERDARGGLKLVARPSFV